MPSDSEKKKKKIFVVSKDKIAAGSTDKIEEAAKEIIEKAAKNQSEKHDEINMQKAIQKIDEENKNSVSEMTFGNNSVKDGLGSSGNKLEKTSETKDGIMKNKKNYADKSTNSLLRENVKEEEAEKLNKKEENSIGVANYDVQKSKSTGDESNKYSGGRANPFLRNNDKKDESPNESKSSALSNKTDDKKDSQEENKNEKPHVAFNEKKNENFSIKPDPSKADVTNGYRPQILMNPPQNSKIIEYRANSVILAEGHFFKQRVIFRCFWHQKYFVLMKDGKLVYHKADGSRPAKGNWDIKHANSICKIEKLNKTHPFRLAFNLDGSARYFSYDTEIERDYWFQMFSKFIHQ